MSVITFYKLDHNTQCDLTIIIICVCGFSAGVVPHAGSDVDE